MKVILIRHGQTEGNKRHAYIGCRTDEPLCEEGREALRGKRLPAVDRVYVSPMKRCVETAEILFPDSEKIVVDDFRECDFGAFEGLDYHQLSGRPDYQAWIDSGGEMRFPGGESRAEFAGRCVKAFREIIPEGEGTFALVVHGGTIMAVMEQFARPRGNYFDFQARNGEGYLLNEDGSWEAVR